MRQASPIVNVMLSLKNGENYLPDLMLSLCQQTMRDYSLSVRDDGSVDRTVASMRLWPGTLAWFENSGTALGVIRSYEQLLTMAQEPYLMFADQDDVWHPDKISKTLTFMKEQERRYGENTPILVHSDLSVCDENLHPIHSSLMRFQSLNPKRNSLKDLMIQNNVTGCTVMINRALADLIRPFPKEAICHDWYIALIASAFGKICFLPESLIDYRQHSANVYGAVNCGTELRRGAIHRELLHRRLNLTRRQAGAFAKQYEDRLSPSQLRMLEAWSNSEFEPSYWKRLATVFRFHFRKNSFIRNLGMWWAI